MILVLGSWTGLEDIHILVFFLLIHTHRCTDMYGTLDIMHMNNRRLALYASLHCRVRSCLCTTRFREAQSICSRYMLDN